MNSKKTNPYKTKMPASISKSQFKPKALEYFRIIQEEERPLIITHNGSPVLKIEPYTDEDYQLKENERIMKELKESILYFDNSIEPVGLEDWEVLK